MLEMDQDSSRRFLTKKSLLPLCNFRSHNFQPFIGRYSGGKFGRWLRYKDIEICGRKKLIQRNVHAMTGCVCSRQLSGRMGSMLSFSWEPVVPAAIQFLPLDLQFVNTSIVLLQLSVLETEQVDSIMLQIT